MKSDLNIGFKDLPARQYLILTFPPVDEIGGPQIYRRALEFDGLIKTYKLPFIFKGALLSMEALRKNSFSTGALIYQVEDPEEIDEKKIYRSREGRYLCIRYKGDPRTQSEVAIGALNRYIEENAVDLLDEVIGFSYFGAHTASKDQDYWSEIQVRVK